VTKTACYANQKHEPTLPRAKGRSTIKTLQRGFGLAPKVIFKKPEMSLSGFSFSWKINLDLIV
jgi:hypothetical protein